MEDEILKNEQLKKQLQITLAKQQLSKEASDYLQEHKDSYSPEQMNEIRTALYDGVELDEISDYYLPDVSPKQMQDLRKQSYVGMRVMVMLDAMSAKLQRMQQLSDDINYRFLKSEKQFHEWIEQLQEERERNTRETESMVNAILLQLKSVHGEQDNRKKSAFLFPGKKTSRDEIRNLIEKGKYNPEQLQELTEAYSSNLPEEQIQLIAKPENSAQIMKQLRLLYEARNNYHVPQQPVAHEETEEQANESEEYDEELDDAYDESEEG